MSEVQKFAVVSGSEQWVWYKDPGLLTAGRFPGVQPVLTSPNLFEMHSPVLSLRIAFLSTL